MHCRSSGAEIKVSGAESKDWDCEKRDEVLSDLSYSIRIVFCLICNKIQCMENLIALTREDKQELRKQLRPAILLSFGMLFMITAVNLSFHFMDVLTGVETVERPPISRLIIIEVLAIVLSMGTYLLLTGNVRKDLKSDLKRSDKSRVERKYFQLENGSRIYKVKLENGTILPIGTELYHAVNDRDMIDFTQAQRSKIVFSAKLTD